MSFLKTLQQKSEPVRKRLVVAFAVGITLLIIVIWVPTLDARFGNGRADGGSTVEAPTPLHSFTDSVRSLFSGVSYEAEQLQRETKENVTSLLEQIEEQESLTDASSGTATTSTTTAE